jgi:NADPH2:quinone reductase
MLLAQKGCIALHRPGFGFYANSGPTRQAACDELFDLVRKRVLRVEIGSRWPLEDAALAHQDAEGGRSVGSVLLIPAQPSACRPAI